MVTIKFNEYTFAIPCMFIKNPLKEEVVKIKIPRTDGVIEQETGKTGRDLKIEGAIKGNSWDDVQSKMTAMESALGTDIGELHIISEERHVYYKARMESIEYEDGPQKYSAGYIIQFFCADPTEYTV